MVEVQAYLQRRLSATSAEQLRASTQQICSTTQAAKALEQLQGYMKGESVP